MKVDKRILIGCVGAMAVLAAIATKYEPGSATRGIHPLKSVDRPIIQSERSNQTQPPVRQAVPRVSGLTTTNWEEEFRTSTDRFPLIAKAAKAALKGDGRAAYYVSVKWVECSALASQYGGQGEPPVDKFNEDMMSYAHAPAELLEKKRKLFQECAGFFRADDRKGNDVFADLPPREGGYRSPKFWMDLAYQEGDPLAQVQHVGLSIGSPMAPNSAAMPTAQADIIQAITSGEPEAIYRAGIIISDGRYVEPYQGFALMLAACDLGYNCTAASSDNNSFPFGECVSMGTCSPGETVADWVAKNAGAEGYAQAYARAQLIETALAQGDTTTLQKFAQLKGST